MRTSEVGPAARRRSLLVAGLTGAGLMAAIDQVVFHQLLQWHHFYDTSDDAAGVLSDGLLHTAELILLVVGLVGALHVQRRRALDVPQARAGLFLGLGAFQLVDAVVVHKVLRLHQVRYGVDLLPYDLAWGGAGLLLLATGAVLLLRTRGTTEARRDTSADRRR